MKPLPITLCLFTSTKGHFGRKTDWKLTLDHWGRQLPLATFGERIAHVKVTPGEESIAAGMVAGLESMGFYVLQTTADWSRGLSHGASYLGDMVTVSKDRRVYRQPYFLLLEDDSLAVSHQISLEDLLLQSCQKLADDHELLTVRLRRRADDRGPETLPLDGAEDRRWFWSQDVNFQPLVMRSLDFYRLCIALEKNPAACQQIQCEQLWRIILDQFSRSLLKHLVYEVGYAETVHVGVPETEHLAAIRGL